MQEYNQFVDEFTKGYQAVCASFIPNPEKSDTENLIDKLTLEFEFVENQRFSINVSDSIYMAKQTYMSCQFFEILDIASKHDMANEFIDHILKLQIPINKVLLKHNMNYWQFIDKLTHVNKSYFTLAFLGKNYLDMIMPISALCKNNEYTIVRMFLIHFEKIVENEMVIAIKDQSIQSFFRMCFFVKKIDNLENMKKFVAYMKELHATFSDEFCDDYLRVMKNKEDLRD